MKTKTKRKGEGREGKGREGKRINNYYFEKCTVFLIALQVFE
jgi:hypothetical protein